MPTFEEAVQDSKKLTSKPSNDDLLQLYGSSPQSWVFCPAHADISALALYKVANGEDITKAEAPGTFDFKVRNYSHILQFIHRVRIIDMQIGEGEEGSLAEGRG